jgi:hypothetical protein
LHLEIPPLFVIPLTYFFTKIFPDNCRTSRFSNRSLAQKLFKKVNSHFQLQWWRDKVATPIELTDDVDGFAFGKPGGKVDSKFEMDVFGVREGK